MSVARFLLLALILIAVMTDCSKDADVAPTVLNQKCYLDSMKVSGVLPYVSTFSYNTSDKLVSGKLIQGTSFMTSSYVYDQLERLVSIVSDTYTDNFEYDDQNRLVQTTRAGSSKEIYSYNANGQLSKLEAYQYDSGSSTFNLYYYGNFTYSSSTSRNPATKMQYDALGNWSHTMVYEYDSYINPFVVVSSSNNTTLTNNVTKLILTQPSTTSTLTQTYTYTYNSDDYPLTQTIVSASGTNVTNYSYNCK